MNQGLELSQEARDLAAFLADGTFERYKHVAGHYRNLANSHLVGKLGEVAAFLWFRDNGLNPVFNALVPGLDKQCDIDTDAGRCEVKTWSSHTWDEWGRCVSVSQLASIKKKADFIFWCVVDDIDSQTPIVRFKGWSSIDVIERHEPKLTGRFGAQVLNHQIDEEHLQGLELLKAGGK